MEKEEKNAVSNIHIQFAIEYSSIKPPNPPLVATVKLLQPRQRLRRMLALIHSGDFKNEHGVIFHVVAEPPIAQITAASCFIGRK